MDEIPLGKDTQYPKKFDSDLLFAIPRNNAREGLSCFEKGKDTVELPFLGYDEWTLYEISWRDEEGNIEMAVGLLRVPCESEYIVESKSLKLYINSLFYHQFSSATNLVEQVRQDLSACLKADIEFSLYSLDKVPEHLSTQMSNRVNTTEFYRSLDHLKVKDTFTCGQYSSQNISFKTSKELNKINRYKTVRFRSLCPVTGQPDWASIYIIVQGVEIDQSDLVNYLVSFSEHQGFHENCVERIYTELKQALPAENLSVAARYTRRGGIDINPIRASDLSFLEMPPREVRQ